MTSSTGTREAGLTILGVATLIALAVYLDDPSGPGPFIVTGIAFVIGLSLTIGGVLSQKRPYAVLLVAGMGLVMLLSYAATAGNGIPVQGGHESVTYTCTSVQIPNATSPTGFTSGTVCTHGPPQYEYNGAAIVYNALFWLPLVGSTVSAMPTWIEASKRTVLMTLARNLGGAAVAGTMLFLTFGLYNITSGYPQLFNGMSPLNPVIAYAYCDSTSFGTGCIQINTSSYIIDYLFWMAIVSLVAILVSEILGSWVHAVRSNIAVYLDPDDANGGRHET